MWRRIFFGILAALLVVGAFFVAVETAFGLANYRDVNYPDSATLLKVRDFLQSGHLYADINRPPYYVTLYGPFTYVLLGVPYALGQAIGIDPQVLVRMVPIAALGLCLRVIFLICAKTYGSRRIAWYGVLLASSLTVLEIWSTQIRGDLPGISLALASLYLILSARESSGGFTRRVVLSSVVAGVAVLVKQVYFAAPAAILCWLLSRKRYREAGVWAVGFGLTFAGVYGFTFWREPLMAQNLAAIRHPVIEYQGTLHILWRAVTQPEVPFAVIGAFVVVKRRVSTILPIILYCLFAWVVALSTIVQVGAGTNYLLEPLLASAILAGAGLAEVRQQLTTMPATAAVLGLGFLLLWFVPDLQDDSGSLAGYRDEIASWSADKRTWRSFTECIGGHNFLSTFPDVTIHAKTPMIPDPFLNSVLERAGTWNFEPVVRQIRAGFFEMIIIEEGETADTPFYRGIHTWNPAMWAAVKQTYTPACVFEGMEVWLPRQDEGAILPSLRRAGCVRPA